MSNHVSGAMAAPTGAAALLELSASVHRSSMHGDWSIRRAAVASLESMAAAAPAPVLRTWLDQFARVNGGGAPAEYAASERIFLLRSLEKIIGKCMQTLRFKNLFLVVVVPGGP